MNNFRRWAKERMLTYGQLKKYLINKKGIIALLAVVLLILILLRNYVTELAVIALLIIIGFCSLLYNRFLKISLGFELIIFSTVAAGFLYGPLAAFITGAVALFSAEVFNQSFQHATLMSFAGLAAVSLAVPYFAGFGITTLGITMALLYNAVIFPGYLLMGSQPWKCILFSTTDIIFNIWVFTSIAPRLLG